MIIVCRQVHIESDPGQLSHLTLISFEVGLQLHSKHAWRLVQSSFTFKVTIDPLFGATFSARVFHCPKESGWVDQEMARAGRGARSTNKL